MEFIVNQLGMISEFAYLSDVRLFINEPSYTVFTK